MIAVAELLNKDRLPGNYFASDAYVQGDFELGLLENRQGNRLIALPDTLLQALYSSLEDEVGSAAGLVMFQCGHWWGKYFYRRFAEEISTYYKKPLAEMEMVEFLQCLKQCWKTYGWGNLNLEFKHYSQGFIIATVENSAFAEVRKTNENAPEKPACYAEAGLLSTFFSQLTGEDLHCVQTTCESMGASENIFILGLEERLKVAEACIEEQQDHETVMMRLGLDQTEVAEPQVSERAEESFTAEETSVAEPTDLEKASLASAEAPEMLADIADLEALNSAEAISAEMTMPPVENINIDMPEDVTDDVSVGLEETADMPEASFAKVEMSAEEMAETPVLESEEALELLTDLPDLETLDSAEEFSADMKMPPVEDINIDMTEDVTENVSVGIEETADMPEASFAEVEMSAEEIAETPVLESTEALGMLTDLPDLEALDSAEEFADMTVPTVEDINIDRPEDVTDGISIGREETADMPEASFAEVEMSAEEIAETPVLESEEALEMLTDLPDLETLDSAEEFSADMTMPPVEDINIDITEDVSENVSVGREETADMPEASFAEVELSTEDMAEAETPAIESTEAMEMLTDRPDLETLDSAEEFSADMTVPPVQDININRPEEGTENVSVGPEETTDMPEASFAEVELSTEDMAEAKTPALESTEALEMLTDQPDLETLDSAEEFSADMTMPPVEDINIDMTEDVSENVSIGIEEPADMPEASFAEVEMSSADMAETPVLESEEALEMLTDLPDLETLDSAEEFSAEMTIPPVDDSNIDMPEAVTEYRSVGFDETASMPEASFAAVKLSAEETAEAEAPIIESTEAMGMLTDLPELGALDSAEEFSADMTVPPVDDSNIDMPEAAIENSFSGLEEMAEIPTPEVIDAPHADESTLSSDSLDALDNLVGLADLDSLNDLENVGE